MCEFHGQGNHLCPKKHVSTYQFFDSSLKIWEKWWYFLWCVMTQNWLLQQWIITITLQNTVGQLTFWFDFLCSEAWETEEKCEGCKGLLKIEGSDFEGTFSYISKLKKIFNFFFKLKFGAQALVNFCKKMKYRSNKLRSMFFVQKRDSI